MSLMRRSSHSGGAQSEDDDCVEQAIADLATQRLACADALPFAVRRIANSTMGLLGPTVATRWIGQARSSGLSRCRECHAAQADTQSWDV